MLQGLCGHEQHKWQNSPWYRKDKSNKGQEHVGPWLSSGTIHLSPLPYPTLNGTPELRRLSCRKKRWPKLIPLLLEVGPSTWLPHFPCKRTSVLRRAEQQNGDILSPWFTPAGLCCPPLESLGLTTTQTRGSRLYDNQSLSMLLLPGHPT